MGFPFLVLWCEKHRIARWWSHLNSALLYHRISPLKRGVAAQRHDTSVKSASACVNCIFPSCACQASCGCFGAKRTRAAAADGGRSVLVSAALGLSPFRPPPVGE